MIREDKGLKAGAPDGEEWTSTAFFVERNA